MNPLQEMILIGEIVLQAKIGLRASERLRTANEALDSLDVWSSIQSILVASANVSKVLWPHNKYKSRGAKLRRLLNVDDNNILSSRKFRNHFEHYDERIEDLFENSSVCSYRDLAMNPNLSNSHFNYCHRGYNSFNNTLVFRNETLDLEALLEALEKIKLSCKPYTLV